MIIKQCFDRHFQNALFVPTRGARNIIRRTLQLLKLCVHPEDRKRIIVSENELKKFGDGEFIVRGRPKFSSDELENTFRKKTVHVISSLRQDIPWEIIRQFNSITEFITKQAFKKDIKNKLIQMITDFFALIKKEGCFLVPFEDFIELLLTIDMLLEAKAKELYIHITSLPGARQDKKRQRECLTAPLFLRLIGLAGRGKIEIVTVLHPHSNVEVMDELVVDPIFPLSLPIRYIKSKPTKNKKIVMIATDVNAAMMNEKVGEKIGAIGTVIMKKERDSDDNPESAVLQGSEFLSEPFNTVFFMIDDMIASGESAELAFKNVVDVCTFRVASKKDIDFNNEEKIKQVEEEVLEKIVFYFYATHGYFTEKNGIDAQDRLTTCGITQVATTNTIFRSKQYMRRNPKEIVFLDISYLLRDIILANQAGFSEGDILQAHIERALKGQPKMKELVLN